MVGGMMAEYKDIFKRPAKHIIDSYKRRADEIRFNNRQNFQYEYFIRTPNGFRSDDTLNHKYGDGRAGYEQWKTENSHLVASHEQINLRPIRERNDYDHIVGYLTETRLSDNSWQTEIVQLADECFVKLCEELEVIDVDTFKFFVFNDIGMFDDVDQELNAKLHALVDVYDNYNDDPNYKKLVDKIKG